MVHVSQSTVSLQGMAVAGTAALPLHLAVSDSRLSQRLVRALLRACPAAARHPDAHGMLLGGTCYYVCGYHSRPTCFVNYIR